MTNVIIGISGIGVLVGGFLNREKISNYLFRGKSVYRILEKFISIYERANPDKNYPEYFKIKQLKKRAKFIDKGLKELDRKYKLVHISMFADQAAYRMKLKKLVQPMYKLAYATYEMDEVLAKQMIECIYQLDKLCTILIC